LIIRIKELLKLLEDFVQASLQLRIARVIGVGSDMALNVLDIIKRQLQAQPLSFDYCMTAKVLSNHYAFADVFQFLPAKRDWYVG